MTIKMASIEKEIIDHAAFIIDGLKVLEPNPTSKEIAEVLYLGKMLKSPND